MARINAKLHAALEAGEHDADEHEALPAALQSFVPISEIEAVQNAGYELIALEEEFVAVHTAAAKKMQLAQLHSSKTKRGGIWGTSGNSRRSWTRSVSSKITATEDDEAEAESPETEAAAEAEAEAGEEEERAELIRMNSLGTPRSRRGGLSAEVPKRAASSAAFAETSPLARGITVRGVADGEGGGREDATREAAAEEKGRGKAEGVGFALGPPGTLPVGARVTVCGLGGGEDSGSMDGCSAVVQSKDGFLLRGDTVRVGKVGSTIKGASGTVTDPDW